MKCLPISVFVHLKSFFFSKSCRIEKSFFTSLNKMIILTIVVQLIYSVTSQLDNCNGIGEHHVTKELFRNQNGTVSYWDRPVRDFNKPVHVDILVWVNSLSEIVKKILIYLGTNFTFIFSPD